MESHLASACVTQALHCEANGKHMLCMQKKYKIPQANVEVRKTLQFMRKKKNSDK